MEKIRKEMFGFMDERMQDLMNKPVAELCQMIIGLEAEVERMKVYRSKLLKIRNLVVEENEKRPQGRPKKSEGEII